MEDLLNTGMLPLIVVAIASYLAGSIPFGLVLTRMAGLGDVREVGSGNIGATNVLRAGGKGIAAATMILDIAKSAAAVAVTLVAAPPLAPVAGLFAVTGHVFPVWLKFNGGKGVATSLGVMLVLAWPVGLLAFATWLIVLGVARISSLAALVALAALPFYAWWLASPVVTLLAAALAVLGISRHHANIRRLLSGEEKKFGGKKAH